MVLLFGGGVGMLLRRKPKLRMDEAIDVQFMEDYIRWGGLMSDQQGMRSGSLYIEILRKLDTGGVTVLD